MTSSNLNTKNLFLLLFFSSLFFLFFSCKQPEPEALKLERIAYVSNGTIHVAGLKDGTHTEVGKGLEPSISYDGRYLAYVTNVGNKQRIAVLDFPNRQTSIVDEVQGTAWGPAWSPAENSFLFSARVQGQDNGYQLIIVGHARNDKKYVLSRPGHDIFSPTWAFDGQTVFGHDTRIMYQWEKTGHLISHFVLNEKFGQLSYNASTRIEPSPDGSYWLIATGQQEPAGKQRRTTLNLHIFDETNNTLKKVSHENVFIGEASWGADNQTIIFSGKDRRNQRQNDLYILSLADNSIKPFQKNATQPCYRTIKVAQAK
jgi:Tol biopolymer transport system component